MQIEIPDELAAAATEIADKAGQDVESLIAEMVTEAIKMRQVPGIVFADGPTGRRARIGGTGIEVFEIIQAYLAAGKDPKELGEAFHWLDQRQVDAALAYYDLFPDDVEPFLFHSDEEFAAFVEEARRRNPFMKPAAT